MPPYHINYIGLFNKYYFYFMYTSNCRLSHDTSPDEMNDICTWLNSKLGGLAADSCAE